MSTFVAKDGTQIYFKDWGSGKPVLFSHGWPLDADMWEYQMEYLSSRGFRTIAFDRRGFGRSDQPWTGNDYDTFADDIAQLIEHLDLQDVTLVGFSMGGGDVARYIAPPRQCPCRRPGVAGRGHADLRPASRLPPRRAWRGVRWHQGRPAEGSCAVHQRLQHAVLRSQ